MDIAALYIGSFLLASIPTAYLIGRIVRGVDIRGYGSGNVGSANLYEHVGKKWVYPVAGVEIFIKGAAPIWVALYVLDIDRTSAFLIGPSLLAVAGNNWSVFLKLQGGRGIAVAGGTLVALSPFLAIMCAVVGAMAAFYHDSIDISDPHQRMVASYRLIAKMPTIAAMAYKYSIGQPYIYPNNDLTYSENFLHMMFAVPSEEYKIDPEMAKAMRLLLILHADHEQNCSTSTVRMVDSSRANLFISIAAGIGALWGTLHGGANQRVIEMLKMIHADGDDYEKYVAMAKDKNSNFKLMGFGHRVYKNFDPRAKILKQSADTLLPKMGIEDPLLQIAKELEQVALKDDFFISRKLYPNVDFYSGILYRALGIPTRMYTVMFALGRLPGWISQWQEMRNAENTRIYRPRQIYTGHTKRDFIPINNMFF